MKTYKDKIYDYLLLEPNLSAEELSQKGDIGDRTYVSKLLASLLEEGKIAQSRSGRNVTYSVIDKKIALEENLKLKGLHEDEIWKTVQKTTDFLDSLSENATNILYFGFTEMLNNAIDHSHSVSGYVKIWQESDSLKFIVKDNGIGIPQEDIPHIFDRFYKVEKAHTPSPTVGSGLGLSIVKRIIEQHGQTITVRSTRGRGTQFTLPCSMPE